MEDPANRENHSHNHHHEHHHMGGNNLRVAFFLNATFTVIELVGGILTNSIAIMSDALHDLGDSLSLGVAWYLEKVSKKAPDHKFSYGYGRFSLLGALLTSMVLIVGSVIILMNAIPRILEPQPVHPEGMLGFAILGIVVNGVAVLRLRKSHSFNEKMAAWHLLEDVLGWVAVLVVSIVLLFYDLPILDPILSLAITFYVLFNVGKNLKKIFRVLLQGVPTHLSVADLENELADIEGVVRAYHTHIWSLEGSRNLLSTHLVVDENVSREQVIHIKEEAIQRMEVYDIDHVTLQIDYPEENNAFCSY
ncbi:MAG: cation diffusion facilitator family transporter [Anaerovoracaceae bacterium]|jgi:cobalt-zinc-cadmium efflux system protein